MRPLLAAALLLVLGACSLPQEGRSRAFAPYAPLEARITAMTASGPLFHVNRPAYVAMFYIAPGSGVSMLYPGFGTGSLDGRVFAGSHFGSQRLNNRDMFLASRAGFGQPRFFFLIASERPLNVKQFGTFGSLLHARLGTSFMSLSAYNTMEELAQLALPSLVNDGSWTTDMYVDWPSVISQEPARNRIFVSCNGYQMYVPIEYLMAVQETICNPLNDAREKQTSDEAAEPEVVKPKARQPLPADGTVGEGAAEAIRAPDVRDRRAVIERISSSSQLGRPIGRPIVDDGRTEVGRPGARGRPEMGPGPASSSGRGASRGAVAGATSRPSGDSSGGTASTPAAAPAAPAAPSGNGGGVSAPSSRPSSGGDGGGS